MDRGVGCDSHVSSFRVGGRNGANEMARTARIHESGETGHEAVGRDAGEQPTRGLGIEENGVDSLCEAFWCRHDSVTQASILWLERREYPELHALEGPR